MISSVNNNVVTANLSVKPEGHGSDIPLTEKDVSLLKVGVDTVTPSLSQEAIGKSMNAFLQSRNSIISQNRSQVNSISNDVYSYF